MLPICVGEQCKVQARNTMFQAQRTHTTRVGSPGSDCRLLSHCVFTCTFKMHVLCYASAVVEVLVWRTVRHTGEMKLGGVGVGWGWRGCVWQQPGEDIIPRCSLSYAGAICHLCEHLQTQGALVTQC